MNLLEETYEKLDLREGRLFNAGESPKEAGIPVEDWVSSGEWLTLAKRMGAEKIYFVGNDPVIVFASLPDGSSVVDEINKYRDAWCLAGPLCLFLATPDEIRVYGLTAPPPASEEEWSQLAPIEIVRRIGDVAEQLSRFQRLQVDSGSAFEGTAFSSRGQRADKQLLLDVQRASALLEEDGLPAGLAHLLIERVLLVRYLEHRGVVTTAYFQSIASSEARWSKVFSGDSREVILNRRQQGFESVLLNRSLTWATFRKLAKDFNGDLFVVSSDEQRLVKQSHLNSIRGMLLGDTDPNQPRMFLWAYDFNIVPITLISSMYERFFHSAEPDDKSGTFYTPIELVQYTVNETLSQSVLEAKPKVLDPACGSGIFLVEAYRAIVRFETLRLKRRLRTSELRSLLLNKISGIDRNPEAIRLAAFSLYLALLSYQRPQDILSSGPLPKLIQDRKSPKSAFVLAIGDAFDFTSSEVENFNVESGNSPRLPWTNGTFDVIVGNPPWTEPPGAEVSQQDRWIRASQLPVGDRSPSQAFIWRSLTLVRPGGIVALLVSAGVFANTRSKSEVFRRNFLKQVSLSKVVNFSDARHLFFARASSPFLLLAFKSSPPDHDTWLPYLTMRRSRAFTNTGSIALGRMDRRIVKQIDLGTRDYLWKTYAWGSHQDANLMSFLDSQDSLGKFLADESLHMACGWQRGGLTAPPYITSVPELSVTRLPEWGPLDPSAMDEAPRTVARPTTASLYSGQRIVITRGVHVGHGPRIRLETVPYSFRHTAYGIPLQGIPEWKAKVIVATLTSSLGRYSLFMRASRWSAWHDEVTEAQILATPLRIKNLSDTSTARVVTAVNQLQAYEAKTKSPLIGIIEEEERANLVGELNESVFDLFELTAAQRDLVNDLQTKQRELSSIEPTPITVPHRVYGTIQDLGEDSADESSLIPYLRTFISNWNIEIGPSGELSWEIHKSANPPILCAVFTSKLVSEVASSDDSKSDEWQKPLEQLEKAISRKVGQDLFVEGTVRSVTDRHIIIAKRDEHRLWTSSAAREDVEATLLLVLKVQKSRT